MQKSLGTPQMHKEIPIALCGGKKKGKLSIKKKKKDSCLGKVHTVLNSNSLQPPDLEIASHAA